MIIECKKIISDIMRGDGILFMPRSWFCDSFWAAVSEDELAELELFHKEK